MLRKRQYKKRFIIYCVWYYCNRCCIFTVYNDSNVMC